MYSERIWLTVSPGSIRDQCPILSFLSLLKHFRCTKPSLSLVQFSSFPSLSCVRVFATPWTAACQASLSITKSWSPPKPMSIELVMPSHPLSYPSPSALNLYQHQSFPMSQLFESGGQSIGVSASPSVLAMNTQYWFPLGWTGWISLQSKELSRVFSNTTVWKHQFFCAKLSLLSNSHIHT